MLKCMWNLPLQKHRWKFKTQWFIGGCSEMPFLKIIDVSDVSLFLMFLAACRIAGAIVWSKLCKEQILSFLFREQCPLKPTLALAIQNSNTRPVWPLWCFLYPEGRGQKNWGYGFTGEGTTWGRMNLNFPQASDKQWAMSGPTRRGSQILLIPRHRQLPRQKRTLSCLSAIQSHKSVLFRCRMRQGHLRTRAWQST